MRIKPRHVIINRHSVETELGKHVLTAHPQAAVEIIPFNTHSYNGTSNSLEPEDFYKEKALKIGVLHRKAQWKPDPNSRSTDFLPAANVMMSKSCAFFCSYCYVNRHYPNGYPKLFDDALNIVAMVEKTIDNLDYWEQKFRQRCKKPFERDRDPLHGPYITFDLGCDSDCVLDNQFTRHEHYSGHVIEAMNGIGEIPEAMSSFATKADDIEPFIRDCKFPGKNRIRMSIMPEHHRRVLEINTATTENRLKAANKLVAAGFEVHLNLSPIVVTKQFFNEYKALLRLIDDLLSPEAKKQLAYEIIFLTHSETLFDSVAIQNPDAHEMMALGPLSLVPKWNKKNVLSYGRADKNMLKKWLRKTINSITPYGRIRYMF